jgi:hypothetical protein
MKRFIGLFILVLSFGTFTGFGNTITDLGENSVVSLDVMEPIVVSINSLDIEMVSLLVSDNVVHPITDMGVYSPVLLEKQFVKKFCIQENLKPPKVNNYTELQYNFSYTDTNNKRARDSL